MIEIELQASTNLRPAPTTDNSAIKSYPKGTKAYGDVWHVIPNDVYKGSTLIQKAGDKWLEVIRVGGVLVHGFMAVIHRSSTSELPKIIRDDGVTPLPEDAIVKVSITFNSGKVKELYPL